VPPSDESVTTEGLLRFSCRRSDACVRFTLTGDLDVATVPALDRALRRAEADVVVLDLRRVQFMGCAGVELLLRIDGRMRQHGGRLVVVRGPEQVERLFALVGVDSDGRLDIVDEPPAEGPARLPLETAELGAA
jgi:anti-anti-sigma factor